MAALAVHTVLSSFRVSLLATKAMSERARDAAPANDSPGGVGMPTMESQLSGRKITGGAEGVLRTATRVPQLNDRTWLMEFCCALGETCTPGSNPRDAGPQNHVVLGSIK